MYQWRAMSALTAMFMAVGLYGGATLTGSQALAMGETPSSSKPKINCRKRKHRNKRACFCRKAKNKDKARCRNQQSNKLNDDQLYQVGYWLAQQGRFEEALVQLNKAANKNDPRILNYIGYSTRKLGRIKEALGYYEKALTANPDYTVARAYMGEAFLEQGKVDLARVQLSEIEKRCGQSCVEYTELSGQIGTFLSTGKFAPQGKLDEKFKEQDG